MRNAMLTFLVVGAVFIGVGCDDVEDVVYSSMTGEAPEPPQISSTQRVVGEGTLASCDEDALRTALEDGAQVTRLRRVGGHLSLRALAGSRREASGRGGRDCPGRRRGDTAGGEGSGVWLGYGDVDFENTTFYANTARWGGAVCSSTETYDASFVNCTFADNAGNWGGALRTPPATPTR